MTAKKKLVVLTGAGISAESGIQTFRDADGLWEGHDVMAVASPQGWDADPVMVLEFYNQRRKQALTAKPNLGHLGLVELEANFDVTIITQNVDTLHEQAGSTDVLHLHGELFKSKSTLDDSLEYDIDGWELKLGDLCEKGGQLRPAIVWFGEQVPMMDTAMTITASADIFMVVGTSLAVYPAASLLHCTPPHTPKYIIDPNIPDLALESEMIIIEEKAGTGVPKVTQILKDKYQ